MRLPEMFGRGGDEGLEPDVQRELSTIDAGLAGLEVHPDYQELASLAVAIRDEAPDVDAEFAAMLDERAAAGFPRTSVPAGARGAARRATGYFGSLRVRRLVPVLGAATSLIVVVAVGASVLNQPNGTGSSTSALSVPPSAGVSSSGSTASGNAASGGSGATYSQTDRIATPGSLERAAKAKFAPATAPQATEPRFALRDSRIPGTPDLANPATSAPAGRHVAQTASLTLSTDPDKVRGIASAVSSIVAAHHGLVISSQITSGKPQPPTGGPVPVPEPLPFETGALGAEFQLRIPASQLNSALDDLSRLGLVVSRDQGTQDITGSFHSVHSRLQDLRSERDRLIAEIPNAVSQEAIDAINARLKVIHAQLSGSENQLGHLQQRVAVVPVHVSVVAKGSGGGDSSFDLGQAAHDAGRVLVVGAGVALISLAVIVPLGLLAALACFATTGIRRRRRERALD